MTGPVRFQLRRTKGWRKPAGSVVVSRPGRWGNWYLIGDPDPMTGEPMTADGVVFWFRCDLDPAVNAMAATDREEIQRELRGKDLGCWCPIGSPCHADVLLEIANGSEDTAKEAA